MASNLPDGVREDDLPGYWDTECEYCEELGETDPECEYCEGTGMRDSRVSPEDLWEDYEPYRADPVD